MIRSPAGFDGGDRIKRYLDYYQPSYGVTMLSAGQFSPASLFAAGEQGVWYDPSDYSTMFQDAAGTTPVTAVEQTVGLILDKSGRSNNASQYTLGPRPVLSARVNQLTYTENFSNAAWAKLRATATTDKVSSDATLVQSFMQVQQDVTKAALSLTYTVSFEAKEAELRYLSIALQDNTNSNGVFVQTDTRNASSTAQGAFGSGFTLNTVTRTLLSDGYCRIVISVTTNTSTTLRMSNAISKNSTFSVTSYTIGEGMFVRNADIRSSNDGVGLPSYQRVNASTDYDVSGFPFYLLFDGANDSLATSNIDFSATDNMSVFAGVRKLSDAAQGVVAELTATIASNDGAFLLAAPDGATATFAFDSKGTIQVDAVASSQTSPLTAVLTGTASISADTCILRVNGTQADSDTGNQGSGNYANAALYIGRRGGATVPYSGRLYSLIVRGASSTATQIDNTEIWVNNKTKAY